MKRKLTTNEFIDRAKKIHGNKYDYSKVNYINIETKVCIICPIHGEFWQTPNNHLKGYDCEFCGKVKRKNFVRKNTEDFIREARCRHGDRYDYSKVEYSHANKKVCIICPEHGEFWQTPNSHIQGSGCPKCNGTHKYTTEEWVKLAKSIHGDRYDYSKVKYKNAHSKVCIICHEKDKYGTEHGEFWQTPNNHINEKHGCPKCRNSVLETEIRNLLNKENINYKEQATFDWLKNKNGVKTLDFYLPDYNLVIECQGIQHFKPIDFANKGIEWANKKYEETIEHDIYKSEKCKEHGIEVLYYSNLNIRYPYKVFRDKNKLIKKIKNNGNL